VVNFQPGFSNEIYSNKALIVFAVSQLTLTLLYVRFLLTRRYLVGFIATHSSMI